MMEENQSLSVDRPVSVSGANGEAIFDRIEEPKDGWDSGVEAGGPSALFASSE